jgi:hypothetical protein
MSLRTARTLAIAVATVVSPAALWPGAARADVLAYVEASSELDDGKPSTFAYNLIDGKDTTMWCSKPGPTGGRLVFGFTDVVTINEIGIVVGAVKGGKLDTRRHRAKEIVVSDGRMERILKMKDVAELQVVKLEPPAKARMIVVEIRDTFAGEPGTPVCLGEVHLKGSRVFTHGDLSRQVRALPTPARRLLHAWVDQVDAPERSLLFALDGTFIYDYTPLLEGRPVKVRGKWRAGHTSLTLEVGSKSYTMQKRLSKVESGDGTSEQLALSGEGPHPSMSAEFQVAPPTME